MAQFRIVEIPGSSDISWEDAARQAILTAAETMDDVGRGEVIHQDISIGSDKKIQYTVKLRISFDL